MRNQFAVLFATVVMSLNAIANVPSALVTLIPAGAENIKISGLTAKGQKCSVSMSGNYETFSASVYVYDENGQLDPKHFAKFQIGFGHYHGDFHAVPEEIKVVAHHEAEEQYSADQRNTIFVNRTTDGLITSVRILNEDKFFLFGYTDRADETCYF